MSHDKTTATPLKRGPAIALLAGLAAGAAACSSVGKVASEPQADVLALSSSYAVQENLGPGPIEVQSAENLARYRIDPKNGASEYLLVLYPEKLSGTLSVKLRTRAASANAGVSGPYFDRLLRAHRLLLKGDLDGAQALATRLEDEFDPGFGTAVLLGNVALLRGDKEAAARRFAQAQSLVPDNGVLGGFVASPAPGGGP
jgi:hypothetical protein